MKKILIGTLYVGCAYIFSGLVFLAVRNEPYSVISWFDSIFAFTMGLLGLAAFFLKKRFRLPAVIFLIWTVGFWLVLSTFPADSCCGLHAFLSAWQDTKTRWEILRGLFFCAWSVFGMAQAFIKEPPRDTIIIIHSLLTLPITGLWMMPFVLFKRLMG